ncbi:hypothetical protein PsYK624_077220 [Phanerochaete sordida]|uniref:F-box domain-containing protein n=1 Tax=Phanerochaete sordida TaxID=48140 RepID=A0A9P3LF16_9APHY|nr:hypothetical protein PsYK624_077220 [Phanerochaete sordida]
MHSSLLVDEIAHTVALCSGDEATVARLARVCRAFYEPALDVLWAQTPLVLEKLLLCLPSDAVYTTRCSIHTGSSTSSPLVCGGLRRTILPLEWDRFIHHARRVKSVKLAILPTILASDTAHADSVHATRTCFEALRAHFNGGSIFSSLQELSTSDLFEPWLDLLIHRRLTSFHFENENPEVLPKVLTKLAPCVPDLRILNTTLWGSGDREEAQAHEALLALCVNLTSLRTNCPISLSTLHGLAPASHLKTLLLTSSVLPSHSSPELPQQYMLFERLECLQLSSSAEDLTYFLHIVSLPAIRRIELSPVINDPEAEFAVLAISIPHTRLLLNALAKHSSLEEIYIYLCPSIESSDILSGDALLVLARLRSITCLSIPIRRVCLRPDHIVAMAAAWPRLQSLALGAWDPRILSADTNFHPSICIEDLYPLAQHCPDLRTLAVSIAGDIAPLVPFTNDESTAVHWSLQELRLQESCLQSGVECTRVANFLSAVFPGARNKFLMNDRHCRSEISAVLAQDAALADTIYLRAEVSA